MRMRFYTVHLYKGVRIMAEALDFSYLKELRTRIDNLRRYL